MIDIVKEAIKHKCNLVRLLHDTMDGKKYQRNSTRWIGDIADHIKICDRIIGNDGISQTKLENALWALDTDSRSEFPAPFWKYIDGK